jgi:hypothetical protein
MTRELHEAILEAAEVVSKTDVMHKEVAEVIGITTRNFRTWRNKDLKDSYLKRSDDDEKLRSLTDWLESHKAYSGPSDTDGMTEYGTGDYGRPEPPEPDVNGATSNGRDFDPEQAIQEQAKRFKRKHRRAQKKKSQTIRFDTGPVMIAFVGDQHIGNQGTDVERIFEEQKTIMQTPGAYCWQMGDVVDNFIVGRLKEQNMKPSAPVWEQWQLAQEYLDRWDDRIISFVGGNHGAWTMGQTQIDYRRDICPDGILFDGDDVKATLSVGSADFDVWARHKWKGNSIYNQTHGQERAARFNDPNHDLYVGAHTHEGALYREMIHEGQRKAAVQIGTYKVHDDYARSQGYPPSDMSTACAVIFHDDGSMHGMADLDAAKRYMQAVYS